LALASRIGMSANQTHLIRRQHMEAVVISKAAHQHSGASAHRKFGTFTSERQHIGILAHQHISIGIGIGIGSISAHQQYGASVSRRLESVMIRLI
jgi:hypothetical protein